MIWGLSLHGWEDVMRGSLAIVGIAGLIVGLATWFVVKLQREEIVASDERIEQLRSDNLKLEAKIAPRRLNAEQSASIVRALEKFGDRIVVIESYAMDAESFGLAQQLVFTMRLKVFVGDLTGSQVVSGATRTGVHVEGPNREFVDAVRAAFKDIRELRQGDILGNTAGGGTLTMRSGGPANMSQADAVVFVGIKPINE